MKKVLFVAVLALAMASCRNSAESTETTSVDSTSVAVDSTLVDSVAVDTTLVAPGHVPAE
jgi:uncharacterized protein YcfL